MHLEASSLQLKEGCFAWNQWLMLLNTRHVLLHCVLSAVIEHISNILSQAFRGSCFFPIGPILFINIPKLLKKWKKQVPVWSFVCASGWFHEFLLRCSKLINHNCYSVIRAEADGLRTKTWVIADDLGSAVCSTQPGYFQVQSDNSSYIPL